MSSALSVLNDHLTRSASPCFPGTFKRSNSRLATPIPAPAPPPGTSIDLAMFPHIASLIVSNASLPALLKIRTLSRALHDAADQRCLSHVVLEAIPDPTRYRGLVGSPPAAISYSLPSGTRLPILPTQVVGHGKRKHVTLDAHTLSRLQHTTHVDFQPSIAHLRSQVQDDLVGTFENIAQTLRFRFDDMVDLEDINVPRTLGLSRLGDQSPPATSPRSSPTRTSTDHQHYISGTPPAVPRRTPSTTSPSTATTTLNILYNEYEQRQLTLHRPASPHHTPPKTLAVVFTRLPPPSRYDPPDQPPWKLWQPLSLFLPFLPHTQLVVAGMREVMPVHWRHLHYPVGQDEVARVMRDKILPARGEDGEHGANGEHGGAEMLCAAAYRARIGEERWVVETTA